MKGTLRQYGIALQSIRYRAEYSHHYIQQGSVTQKERQTVMRSVSTLKYDLSGIATDAVMCRDQRLNAAQIAVDVLYKGE